MNVKFLRPTMLKTLRGIKSFGAGDQTDLPESMALYLETQGRAELPDRAFAVLENVLARKVSKYGRRTHLYHEPEWCRGTILEIDELRKLAKIASGGEQFWASLSTLKKL